MNERKYGPKYQARVDIELKIIESFRQNKPVDKIVAGYDQYVASLFGAVSLPEIRFLSRSKAGELMQLAKLYQHNQAAQIFSHLHQILDEGNGWYYKGHPNKRFGLGFPTLIKFLDPNRPTKVSLNGLNPSINPPQSP